MKFFKVLLLAGAVVSIASMAWLQLFVLVANKLFTKPVIQHQP